MSGYNYKPVSSHTTYHQLGVCCADRIHLLRNLGIAVVALIILCGFIGFCIAIAALLFSLYPLSQVTYSLSGGALIPPSPLSTVISGGIAMHMTLPNDLSDYVGKVYHIDCVTPAIVNTVTILSGPVNSAWDGAGHKVATCTGVGGFSFKVSSNAVVRVLGGAINVVFS